MSAAGGAVGALPLVGVARTLAVKFFAASVLPGAERLTSDLKQATYFETAVLFTVVPAAALFFGRTVPRELEARGVPSDRAELAGIGFGSSFLLWRAGLSAKAAVFVGLVFAASIICAPLLRRSRIVVATALLGLLIAGLTASYRPASRLNLFEDGQVLFGASALASGARPYVDFYPVHGWGSDGGLDALFFRPDLRDLRTFRIVRAAMTALALASLGAAAWLFFADAAWGALGLITSLTFCPFLSERHMPALFGLCLLIWAARSQKGRPWIWAGVCSAVTLFSNLDFGVIFLLGGSGAPLALSLVAGDPARRVAGDTGRFGLGVLLGSVPFVICLAFQGALREFLRVSFLEIPASIIPTWGFPADSFTKALREGSLLECLNLFNPSQAPGLCLLLLLLASGTVLLLLRARGGLIDAPDRAATVCLLLAVLGLRGVLGRADVGHRMLYGILAGLPTTWLVYRVSRVAAARSRLLVGLLTATVFCLILRPDRVVGLELGSVLRAGEQRRAEIRAAASLPACPSAMLPMDQLREIVTLREFIDAAVPPGKTFFDFGNEPALYFLLERKPPIRFSNVALYEMAEKQREVIRALERERPPIVILSSGTYDVLDSVPNRQRAPLVARYLDDHYRQLAQVGPRTLGGLQTP